MRARGANRSSEKLGLVPQPVRGATAKAIALTYKLLGFGILTLIVTVLIGYVASTGFYIVSSSWVTPTVVSALDDKVVALKTALAARQNQRDNHRRATTKNNIVEAPPPYSIASKACVPIDF